MLLGREGVVGKGRVKKETDGEGAVEGGCVVEEVVVLEGVEVVCWIW